MRYSSSVKYRFHGFLRAFLGLFLSLRDWSAETNLYRLKLLKLFLLISWKISLAKNSV